MTGTRPPTRAPFGSEGRVLYTLLDAAQAAGLIRDFALQQQWREIEARLKAKPHYFDEADAMHALLAEIEAEGSLAGTWIEERWRSVQQRASRPPF
jgi:hypothetical protein